MSDIAKLLDNGRIVVLFHNSLGRYTAAALSDESIIAADILGEILEMDDLSLDHTDDVTPDKALQRLSEKAFRTGDYVDWPESIE